MNSSLTDWHTQQATRAAHYKVKRPEIPGNYRCAGECSTQPPPPPPGSVNEAFTAMSALPRQWWMYVGTAAAVYLLITMRLKNVK
jgi:hypothetical protein